MYYLNNGHLVHDLKNEMDQISDIRSPKGVFDQQIVADRFDMNDDACRRVNIFSMPALKDLKDKLDWGGQMCFYAKQILDVNLRG